MRRMYSEQELTKIIGDVFDQKIEAGAFNESIADAVDAYLVEHPVDITALEGQDIAPKDISATGDITAPSIIETMSGYSASVITQYVEWTPEYIGACKNGNKLTLVVFGSFTLAESGIYADVVNITIPSAVGAKLFPFTIGGDQRYLDRKTIDVNSSTNAGVNPKSAFAYVLKVSNTELKIGLRNDALEAGSYFFRIESTFLLSSNLAPEE